MPAAKFAKDYSGKEEIINQLTEAILQRKSCLVTYHSFSDDKVKDFSINPLHFYERDGGLYIFAHTTAYGDVITLAVERINSLVITPDAFEYPKSFEPEAMLDSTFDFFTKSLRISKSGSPLTRRATSRKENGLKLRRLKIRPTDQSFSP